MKAGVYTIPPERYHADPADEPSLSAHTAHVLLTRSPLHAWTQHPRLNPDYQREERGTFDLGTAVHDLWLRGKQDTVRVVEADDWRTKLAREQRDEAYAAGLVPLLAKDWQRVREMVDAIEGQLAEREDDPPLFAKAGKPEQTVAWRERGVTCRALVDWLHNDHSAIDDLKTCWSANPFTWTRSVMWNIGADIQAVMHKLGVQRVTGRDPLFRFVVVEKQPPYALSVVSLAPAAIALAEDKVNHALDVWRRCLEAGDWPAYTKEVCYAEPAPWSESQWLEQQAIEGLWEEQAA